MTTTVYNLSGLTIALCESDLPLITDAGTALDFMMTLRYDSDCSRIALNKAALIEDFFMLSTGVAGDVLQKVVNYRFKLAIYGDFSHYTSKPLRDFMGESNRGSAIFFAATADEALTMLASAR